jgi:uncharacterized protein
MKLKIILILVLLIAIAVIVTVLIKPELIPFHGLSLNGISKAKKQDNDTVRVAVRFEQQLMEQLHKLEVSNQNIKQTVFKPDSAIEITTSIPRGKPMEWVIWMITSELKDAPYTMDDCYYESETKGCRIQFSCKEKGNPIFVLILMRSSAYFTSTAKMAIFIEDFGFQADETTVKYLSFPEPLTVGLLPEKKLTTWTAQIADEYKKEIVLMLPMEPVPAAFAKQSNSVIMVHYTEDKIRQLVTDAMERIPNFNGVANYYGSRVLADSKVLSLLLDQIGSRNSYFLYFPQHRNTSINDVAKNSGTPFVSVDIQIDTTFSVVQIQDTLRHCAMIAQKTGTVVISSKPHSSFIQALTNEIPVLKQNGIRLVYISELAKRR